VAHTRDRHSFPTRRSSDLRIAGLFIIVMGLFIGGWLQSKTLMKERRIQSKKKPIGFLGTFFVGVGFAAGWTPCIGPIFASILLRSEEHTSELQSRFDLVCR